MQRLLKSRETLLAPEDPLALLGLQSLETLHVRNTGLALRLLSRETLIAPESNLALMLESLGTLHVRDTILAQIVKSSILPPPLVGQRALLHQSRLILQVLLSPTRSQVLPFPTRSP
jgi:hypothetical protein